MWRKGRGHGQLPSRRFTGKGQANASAAVDRAVDVQLTSMGLNHAVDERQAETGARCPRREKGRRGPCESDGCHSHPVVMYLDDQTLFNDTCSDEHMPVFFKGLDRVLQDVLECLTEQFRIEKLQILVGSSFGGGAQSGCECLGDVSQCLLRRRIFGFDGFLYCFLDRRGMLC